MEERQGRPRVPDEGQGSAASQQGAEQTSAGFKPQIPRSKSGSSRLSQTMLSDGHGASRAYGEHRRDGLDVAQVSLGTPSERRSAPASRRRCGGGKCMKLILKRSAPSANYSGSCTELPSLNLRCPPGQKKSLTPNVSANVICINEHSG